MNYCDIQIKLKDAPLQSDGVDEATDKPIYREWDDGLPRQYFHCSILVPGDGEPQICTMESACFLPAEKSRALAQILFYAGAQITSLP